jgi:hypothetical protein
MNKTAMKAIRDLASEIASLDKVEERLLEVQRGTCPAKRWAKSIPSASDPRGFVVVMYYLSPLHPHDFGRRFGALNRKREHLARQLKNLARKL